MLLVFATPLRHTPSRCAIIAASLAAAFSILLYYPKRCYIRRRYAMRKRGDMHDDMPLFAIIIIMLCRCCRHYAYDMMPRKMPRCCRFSLFIFFLLFSRYMILFSIHIIIILLSLHCWIYYYKI